MLRDILRAERRTDTVAQHAKRGALRRNRDDIGDFAGGFQGDCQRVLRARLQEYAVAHDCLVFGGRDPDFVGPADAQAAGVELTGTSGLATRHRAGRHVPNGDFGAGDGGPVGGNHLSTNTGRGLLRHDGLAGQAGDQQKRHGQKQADAGLWSINVHD